MANQGPKTTPPRHSLISIAALAALLANAAACRKDTAGPAPGEAPSAPPAIAAPHIDVDAIVSRVGAKPGGLTYAGVGPAAALMSNRGQLTIRRTGVEKVIDATPRLALQAGDQIRTGAHSEATIALADNTIIQMAGETVIAIGNRGVSSDPASSAAVLYGVARLSISPRARGEGAFLTIAGGNYVGAKGTVFGIAVLAGGQVRVGVEHGEAEVAGAAALDKPVTVATGEAVIVDAAGVVGAAEPFKQDDWGTWRFASEGRENLDAVARLHADRLVRTEGRLDADYVALQALATSASTLTWRAEANAKPAGLADYKATAVERAAAIEATYRLSIEIARLTNAALSDAFILTELYTRHPKELEAQIMEFGQEVSGAVLYNKKLQLVAEIYLQPLRAAYYAHTARGRARAATIELRLPPSAQGKLADLSAAEIAKQLPRPLYAPPRLESTTRPHPLWQGAPAVGWDTRLTLQPVPPRQGSWYVEPARLDARLLAGVPAQRPLPPAFPPAEAAESAKAELAFLVPPLPPMGTPDAGAR